MFSQIELIGPILKQKAISNAKINASTWAGRQKKNLSPSQDFLCMSKAYFNFKFSGSGYLTPNNDEFSYENERAKQVGNQAHEYIQNILKTAGVMRACEMTMTDDEHHIRARLDMILEINNKLYLVELKTAKSYSIKMMVKDGSPDLEHQKQLQLYFHLYDKCKNEPEVFALLKGRPLNGGILLYEGKDDHKITEFVVNKNPAIIKDLLRYADVLMEHVKKGTEPNFKFEPDAPECIYKCKPQYYLLCHGKTLEEAKKKDVPEPAEGTSLWGVSDTRLTSGDKFV